MFDVNLAESGEKQTSWSDMFLKNGQVRDMLLEDGMSWYGLDDQPI